MLFQSSFLTEYSRYFARAWSAPQQADPEALAQQEAAISSRLATLKATQPPVVPASTLAELEKALPLLYADHYPKVLTHGDLSLTNILVDPTTCAITGLVDWSLASVRPFGLELHCFFLMSGFMDMDGWHDYACRSRLVDAFWDAFWLALGSAAGADDVESRGRIRALAEAAAKIGAIMCYAFKRNGDGSPSEELSTSESMLGNLKAWL